MKIAITGSEGFLARHLRVRLRALAPDENVVSIGRSLLMNDSALDVALAGSDAVVHLAGINRGNPTELDKGNAEIAERLVAGLDRIGATPRLIYGNSRQAGAPTPYGEGKARAARILSQWAQRSGASYVDVELPNVFGEGGKPDYNSVVATFCHRLATGASEPRIDVDKTLNLLHAQDAAEVFMTQLSAASDHGVIRPGGTPTTVSDVLARLEDIASIYRSARFPDLGDPLTLQLFNTYRYYLYPQSFPMPLVSHRDARGAFVETTQALGGESQTSFSTTKPGVTRGNHFHLRKVERFVVVKGRARIDIRPIWGGPVVSFDVSGDDPSFVDMPTLQTHSITNAGTETLYTIFWISELYDPRDSDTFGEAVI